MRKHGFRTDASVLVHIINMCERNDAFVVHRLMFLSGLKKKSLLNAFHYSQKRVSELSGRSTCDWNGRGGSGEHNHSQRWNYAQVSLIRLSLSWITVSMLSRVRFEKKEAYGEA